MPRLADRARHCLLHVPMAAVLTWERVEKIHPRLNTEEEDRRDEVKGNREVWEATLPAATVDVTGVIVTGYTYHYICHGPSSQRKMTAPGTASRKGSLSLSR